jgi:hypothetical protein
VLYGPPRCTGPFTVGAHGVNAITRACLPYVRGVGALAADVGEAVRLLLVDTDTSQEWLHRLARTFLDGGDRIEFAEGWVARPPGRSIVVLYYGATAIDDLPSLLGEVIVQFPDRS